MSVESSSKIEERFKAAVNVIRGLPKNGPYQPSNDMLLKFYANFKQSTEGPCRGRRPAFWDIVGRAKYDAWKNLGELPKERAMENYVDELKKIVETMSYTENVANFMGSVSDLDNINVEDLQLVAPEAIKKVRSRPNSPFHSRETSPVRSESAFADELSYGQTKQFLDNQNIQQDNLIATTNGYTNGYTNGGHSTDISDDEFIDTVEDDIPVTPVEHLSRSRERKNYSQMNGSVPNKMVNLAEVNNKLNFDPALITSLVHLTDRMKLDMAQVNNRMNALEQKIKGKKKYPSWWPFEDISPQWFMLGVFWPIIVVGFFRYMQQKRSLRRS